MNKVGQKEIVTQKRVLQLLQNELGYHYLGDWHYRDSNSNVEEELLSNWLQRQGHSHAIVRKVLFKLNKATSLGGSRTLYSANREVYNLLRYGVTVKPDLGEQSVHVWLIDWEEVEKNDFAVAEEVTVIGKNNKRPDIFFYVNGIAIGVLELKSSTVSVSKGIRQNIESQDKKFIRPFFSTVQFVMAGNDTEGLRYGVIHTSEKYFLTWKEESPRENRLDRALTQICNKERFLEIIHNFIVFDAGTKKICRYNQYFGVRAAQEFVKRREGGIIWHTQGSGKSLTMVWLAKWIRENVTNSRVLIITDRTELDEQIEKVFAGVNEQIYRTKSGADLVQVLNKSEEWLICSLIHKFGRGEDLQEKEIKSYIEEIRKNLPKEFRAKGEIVVFVDECHRTQSGKLHEAMKALLPEATLIGFTGTPLLKREKKTSLEIFGPYIHTYKYDQAVEDGVVLDLRYEARNIEQNITSPERIDQWFEAKTRGLSNLARAQLKQRWGTMQKVLSSQDRLEKIAADILMDMARKERLMNGHGNAILVSDSIYAACRYFEIFQKTDLAGKSAIVTSYRPSVATIKGEESGEGMTEKLERYNIYQEMLANHFNESKEKALTKVETFEKEVKKRFIEEPGQMKLLIVVDKLLTGFDAPSATYLYIDKRMRNHGLFQAICRVNRLDGEEKEYGYVIDYMDLFKSLEKSIKDYTGEVFDGYDKEDVSGLLKDRLQKGRERLEEMREAVKGLCNPVDLPRETHDYIRFFCDDPSNPERLNSTEPKRIVLYKVTASLFRAYANLANEMEEAGYSEAETKTIKAEVDHYQKACEAVKIASSDKVDMKQYEPAMRHLLNTYIRADESEKLSAFDDMTLVELIVERGEAALDELPKGIRDSPEAMAETIENNVRKLIIDEMGINPKYYEKMSKLLDALIQLRKEEATDYKAYLEKIIELTKKVSKPETASSYPPTINSPRLRALYDNLEDPSDGRVAENRSSYGTKTVLLREEQTIALDRAIRNVKKALWRGNRLKEREVRIAIKSVIGENDDLVNSIFEIVKNQREY